MKNKISLSSLSIKLVICSSLFMITNANANELWGWGAWDFHKPDNKFINKLGKKLFNKKKSISANNTPPKKNVTSEQQKTISQAFPKPFVLQLLASTQESKVQDFIKRHKLETMTNYYHVYHQKKSWYILVYGQYESSEAAKLALNTLPENLQTLSPWPRTLKSIRQAQHQSTH